MKKNIQCSTILANNCDEIDFAWQKGVPKKTPIFTFSPSINLEKKYRSNLFFKYWGFCQRENLMKKRNPLVSGS